MSKNNNIAHKLYTSEIIQLSLLVVLIILFTSCSGTRRLSDDQYLLHKNKVRIDNKDIDKRVFKQYNRQKPNKKILVFFKVHLFMYNLANPQKDNSLHNWLRRIGETPVIYDKGLQNLTIERYQLYLESKGYYHSHIKDTTTFNNQKAIAVYSVKTGKPYIIRNISYVIEDTTIQKIIFNDTINSFIKTGIAFDKNILQEERERIEYLMKTHGYFKFKKEYNYVQFEATRQKESFLLDLKIIIKQSLTGYIDPYSKIRRHQKYVIDSVKVYTNFNTNTVDSTSTKSIVKDDINFIYSDNEFIKANTLKNFNTCYPNSLYDIQEIELTTNKLSSLGLFKMVNITPIEKVPKRNEVSEFGHLNYQIELVPRKRQNFQTELIGTISSNDPGAGATFSYSNYNLLRGAERLTLKLSGVIERVKRLATQDQQQDFKREFKIETKIETPKFFIPLKASEFTRKYSPKTTINLSYNYQDRIEYLGTLFNASFGYYWKGNKFTKHSIIPLDVNYINIKIRKDEFYDDIKGTPLENSFTSHSILGLRYSFEYSTQVLEKLDNYFYFKYNFESAGFLLDLAKKNVGFLGPDSTLFDVTYSNFVKSDIELRKYYKQARDNWLVFRFFAGVGIPYGNNAISLPYEKMYFSGGPYGIRAWETRTLGPGSDTTIFGGYANNMGDIKLEANIEYRFDLFWKFEGAMFLDAGNIWLIKEDLSRPKAVFKWDKFHTEFALGTGFGLRLDLSFLLARFDIGYKLRDPALTSNSGRWTFNQYYNPVKLWSFQLGIGYPF